MFLREARCCDSALVLHNAHDVLHTLYFPTPNANNGSCATKQNLSRGARATSPAEAMLVNCAVHVALITAAAGAGAPLLGLCMQLTHLDTATSGTDISRLQSLHPDSNSALPSWLQ
jgi:hypothetical protein